MLDENLPTFFIKPSTESDLQSTIYLGQSGNALQPEYTIRRPDPNLSASKNCYAVALYDSYNPEVLFAEVLVQPEWTQPTLSQAEIRANNGSSPPPIPVVPNSFAIQLYNPDQQVNVRQIAGSWNSSAYWEFEMPQQTFRMPSASSLDRSQSDPAASDVTPKVTFKWKRDSKLSKDISCYLAGKSTDGKKSREPDITIAMFKHGKELTVYEPNMNRVDVEDIKGLEVVILLGAMVIKDIFFNASRDMFNISSPTIGARKNSNGLPLIGGKPNPSPPRASGGVGAPPANNIPASQIIPERTPRPYGSNSTPPSSRPPPADPRTQWEIDAETARLRALVEAEEKERERAERLEQKRIKKMLEEEEKEQRRRDAVVAKETERLRRQYGVQPIPDSIRTPSMPPRPHNSQRPPPQPPRPQSYGRPPGGPQQHPSQPQYLSTPYAPQPARPSSVPPPVSATSGPFNCPSLHNWWHGSSAPPPPQNPSSRHRNSASASTPYLMTPAAAAGTSGNRASGSSLSINNLLGMGVEGEGGRKKVSKKRSVYF